MTINIEEGAVTFIDVLGWKGKWKEGYESINLLSGLIENAREYTYTCHENILSRYSKNDSIKKQLRGVETNILSISDTIAIFTKGPAAPTIALHGMICEFLLPESIKLNIPLRGSTSYGKYSISGNIMIGPAIDEAASWHELTNWIGVTLTPSAKYSLNGNYPEEWTKYPKIPYKKRVDTLDYCVDWDFEISELVTLFQQMGPHVPEIAEKYLNTLEFLNTKSRKRKIETSL